MNFFASLKKVVTQQLLKSLRPFRQQHFQQTKENIFSRNKCSDFLPKLKCATALLLYSLALSSLSLQFTLIPSV